MKEFIDLALQGGPEGRGDDQYGWYQMFPWFFHNKTVLDVGTGISRIKERTKTMAAIVTTHEACEKLPADIHGDLANVASKSFDTVTCFDVIEHVKDYGRLLYNMARISKSGIVITTPGFAITKCTNPYHWHEFMSDELRNLIEATGMIFSLGYGAEWKSYPNEPGPVREITYEELRSDIQIHPIAVGFQHP